MSVCQSVDYLSSEAALQSLRADAYWPKWNSPWWHMTLLHEMGEAAAIPERAVEAMVLALARSPLTTFPIEPEEVSPDSHCHCALGNIYQMLAARGVDVDRELPWIRAWFLRYQMEDGGFNCDETAYRVADECPSSMVATIAAFESIVLHTPRPFTDEESRFVQKGAQFLIQRQLHLGSSSRQNAAEREQAQNWLQVCFPRFYFYDVLRGLEALTAWSRRTRTPIPAEATAFVRAHLAREFPHGVVQPQRLSYEGTRSRGKQEASLFPLLEEVSRLGVPSPSLTARLAAAVGQE